MRVGVYIPNGAGGDFPGWDMREAWERTLDLARLSEKLGYESLWVPDHLQNVRVHNDLPTFEIFPQMTAFAMVTERVTIGSAVLCAGWRNPALLYKMMSTLDVASNGRAEIAIGAGWNEWEWRGYGYGFPSGRERLKLLEEALEIISRMQQPGRQSWQGEHFHIDDVVCEPKSIRQPRMPLIVGGNGQKVTWRWAARFADELNLDGPSIEQIAEWMPIIRQRCEEIGRDPATMPVSTLLRWRGVTGQQRVEGLQFLAELGLNRILTDNVALMDSDEPLYEYIEDCKAAGVELLV
jgi:alkanesulfonate monooxygenase SsuD/methylene tetrahydromethanopterin reductase-like flavin-dependent oxidoreductase (luciferase family)